jgi:hypothetical protein
MIMPRFAKSYRHSHQRSREKGIFATKYGEIWTETGSISLKCGYLAETTKLGTRQRGNTPCASDLHGISLDVWGQLLGLFCL